MTILSLFFMRSHGGAIVPPRVTPDPPPRRRMLGTEMLILLVSLFFSLFCNQRFWQAALQGGGWLQFDRLPLLLAGFVILIALHSLLLGLVLNRHNARLLLSALFFCTALATHYMNRYTVFFDPGMMRNVLRTDFKEAHEFLSLELLRDLFLYALLPTLAIWRLPLAKRGWARGLRLRALFLFGMLLVAVASAGLSYQSLAALMRNDKQLRYLVTPGSYLISTLRVLGADGLRQEPGRRIPVGTDARLAEAWSQHRKPALLIVVNGETARAANWGLNGYARQTTPELAASDAINFPQVSACGSSTEVSLPCMYSPFGRRAYDERRIKEHESVLHVFQHAGFRVLWRDNQSGCKDVCEGLEQQSLAGRKDPLLCQGERCLDEILLQGLEQEIRRTPGNLVVVLHQIGNHGPGYWRRYPPAFRRYLPECDSDDLGRCSRQQIVNSYDNALSYTDHFLARTIELLKTQQTHDAALIYVSDHGESLGENGFYLHGLPYAIAPREQLQVPMLAWISPAFAHSFGLDTTCLRQAAQQPASHDNLFHSLLGLLLVETRDYQRALDFSAACRHA